MCVIFLFIFWFLIFFFGFSCFKIAYWSNFWTILTALKLICLLWLTITLLKLCLKSKPMKSWALWVWLVGISDVSVGKVVCICSSVCVLVCVCVVRMCVWQSSLLWWEWGSCLVFMRKVCWLYAHICKCISSLIFVLVFGFCLQQLKFWISVSLLVYFRCLSRIFGYFYLHTRSFAFM